MIFFLYFKCLKLSPCQYDIVVIVIELLLADAQTKFYVNVNSNIWKLGLVATESRLVMAWWW